MMTWFVSCVRLTTEPCLNNSLSTRSCCLQVCDIVLLSSFSLKSAMRQAAGINSFLIYCLHFYTDSISWPSLPSASMSIHSLPLVFPSQSHKISHHGFPISDSFTIQSDHSHSLLVCSIYKKNSCLVNVLKNECCWLESAIRMYDILWRHPLFTVLFT